MPNSPKGKSKKIFPETTLEEVAGGLKYEGVAKTLEEMDAAIEEGVRRQTAEHTGKPNSQRPKKNEI